MNMTLGSKLAAACCALLMVAACGGGARPSTDEMAQAISNGESAMGSLPDNVGDSAAECIADALHASDLSDETLQAFVEGDQDYEGTEDEEKTLDSLESEMKECVSK